MPISWICRWTLACFPRNLPINQGRDEGFSLSVYDEFPCSANPPTWSFQHPRPSFLTKGIPTWGTTAPSYWPPAVRSKPPHLVTFPKGKKALAQGHSATTLGEGGGIYTAKPLPVGKFPAWIHHSNDGLGETLMSTCPWKIGENNENQRAWIWRALNLNFCRFS